MRMLYAYSLAMAVWDYCFTLGESGGSFLGACAPQFCGVFLLLLFYGSCGSSVRIIHSTLSWIHLWVGYEVWRLRQRPSLGLLSRNNFMGWLSKKKTNNQFHGMISSDLQRRYWEEYYGISTFDLFRGFGIVYYFLLSWCCSIFVVKTFKVIW